MTSANDTFSSIKPGLDIHTPSGKCPYIGIITDADTALDYPSSWNACHHSKPPAVPIPGHQQHFCLTGKYDQCEVYHSELGSSFPKPLSEPNISKSNKGKSLIIIGGIVFLVVLGFFLLIKRILPGKLVEEPVNSTPNQEQTINQSFLEVTAQALVTMPTIPEVEKTSTSGVIAPETITPMMASPTNDVILHKLDVPIGKDQKFIIHQVLDGESLEQYAVLYNTNRETITKLNYFLPVPLWVNWLVIIPVNLTDLGDLPTFEAYLVTEETIKIGKLSEKLAVNLADLSYYNGIGDDHVMNSGEWLLIPREGYMLYNP